MSEIEKYKKYLNFKAKPRYLRRDFIVPLYTGTEPDILAASSEERVLNRQPFYQEPKELVQDDSASPQVDSIPLYQGVQPGVAIEERMPIYLPPDMAPVMPSISDFSNPQDRILEIAEGGRVNFQKAGRVFGELPQDVKSYKGGRLNTFEEGLNDLIKWKKNPTSDNWIQLFGYKSASGQNRTSEFSNNLRSYLRGTLEKDTTKELFDKIKIKNYLKDNIKDIKNLDSSLIERRQTAGTKGRAEKQLGASAERIKLINEEFKKNQRIGLEDLTKNIYKTKFTKADDIEKLKLSTQVSDDVTKYLEALKGIRTGIPELPTGNKLKNISDYIEKNTVLFRFREGNLRRYKFNIADKERGFGLNYTENLINKIRGKGRVADEAVGLSATFKNAPGYLEATQFLKASTNNLKGRKIDKFFIEALKPALEGDKSKVKDYNKKALQFKNKNPNVDVPFIKYGSTLNEIKNNVKYFDDFSDVSKENILKIAKEKGIIIKTQAKPLTMIVDEFKDATNTTDKIQQAAKLKKLGLNPKQSALYTSFIPGLESFGEDLATGKYGKATLKGLGVLGTAIGAKDFVEMYDAGEPILDTVLYGGIGIPGSAGRPVTALAKYKNFSPEGKLAEKRLDTLRDFREGIFKPQDVAIVATKLDPQYQGDPNQYLNFLEQNESIFKKDIELAEEKFQKETMQPFKEEKMKTRLPIMETPIIKKIVENYRQIVPEDTETETEIEQPLEQPPEELPSEYKVSAAEGGRIGLGKGSGPKIGRRGFLGLIAGAAAAPDLIKSLKGTGQAAKIASKIKLEPAEGMYPWFPKLVEKVKEMGKPFKEKDLIMEPSYKNDPRPFGSRQPTGEEKLTKHVDGDTTFILREYPDGRLAVDIDSPRNQESFGQPVSLYYRPKMEIQNYKGEKKIEPPEFKVLEPEPRLFANGPDDVDITFTEVPKNPKRNTVFGDIEAAERFATGNIKNRKIIPVKQSLRNEMEEDPSTFIMRQSGELGSKARPEEIIKLPEEFATGGRVEFSGGGVVKFARMITDLLNSLKKDLSFSSHLEKLYGSEAAKKQILSPYRIPEGTNKSQQSDILTRIDEIKQNLPKEYSGLINTLDDIEKNVNDYNYIDASKKGTVLLDKLPDSFNFEKLPQNLFPMEDPLNDAFILFDPKREKMVGRYTMRYNIDPETNKGIIQTYDTYDPVSKKFLEEKDWKLIGVDAREESGVITKEGLN